MSKQGVEAALRAMDEDEARTQLAAGDLSALVDVELTDDETEMVRAAALDYPEVEGFSFAAFATTGSAFEIRSMPTPGAVFEHRLTPTPGAVFEHRSMPTAGSAFEIRLMPTGSMAGGPYLQAFRYAMG